jgi:jumonji domain-containing protein 2
MTATNNDTFVREFRPTIDEFKNFSHYIDKIESEGAIQYGIVKVVPPKEWQASQNGDYSKLCDVKIENPLKQKFTKKKEGVYELKPSHKNKVFTVKEFEKLANSTSNAPPGNLSQEDIEKKYWATIDKKERIYGADVSFSLMDSQLWNMNNLGTLLDDLRDYREKDAYRIEGVNTPFLYFGTWGSTFAWHTEDMDLYSISYLHFGEPKSWYSIPSEYSRKFEEFVRKLFAPQCNAFLRHKTIVISPSMLVENSIPYFKVKLKDFLELILNNFIRCSFLDDSKSWRIRYYISEMLPCRL